ncbi:MAG: T9SS type A sorting domain-containing protein [Bacteroidales bacterium]|nr:T9SS type A sorting domain-containing protein [Bacteroidales bacterium]
MKKRIFTYLMLICFPFLLFAQWSNDPLLNTEIMDTIGEQVLPKIVVHTNGESYISWFSEFDDFNYNVYMQRLDANGNKLWGENGLLISNHPTETWFTDYDLIIDQDSCAILVTQDYRTGYSNVFAYRISHEGEFFWGNNGIALTNDEYFNPSPKVVETNKGDFIFIWNIDHFDTSQNMKIGLQRVSKNGDILWGNDVIISDSFHNYEPDILFTEDDNIIVAWNRTKCFDSILGQACFMHIHAQKIDTNGNFVWQNNIQIDTGNLLPSLSNIKPVLENDGNGGAYIMWEAEYLFSTTTFVQHIGADGNVQWAANGKEVSTLQENSHSEAALCYHDGFNQVFVFWQEYHYDGVNLQDNFGVYGQRLSGTGHRLWGDAGKALVELTPDTIFYNIRAKKSSDIDIGVFFKKEYFVINPPDTLFKTKINAMRIDHQGEFVWEKEKIVLSSVESGKMYMEVSDFMSSQWIAVWADNRNDPQFEYETGIYAQNISIVGNLGPTGIKEKNKFTANTLLNYPNPFKNSTTIEYKITETCNVNISLYTLQGHFVKNIFNGIKTPGTYTMNISGNELSPGIYIYKLKTDNYNIFNKMVIIK